MQQPKAQSSMSPYLVPDAAALCQHLGILRQLAGSGCFIIIIPRTGTRSHLTNCALPDFHLFDILAIGQTLFHTVSYMAYILDGR